MCAVWSGAALNSCQVHPWGLNMPSVPENHNLGHNNPTSVQSFMVYKPFTNSTLFTSLNNSRQILCLCPPLHPRQPCPNSGLHRLSVDYYNSLLTGLSAPICLPLIHSLHSSKSNLSHKESCPLPPLLTPSNSSPLHLG